MVDKKSCFRETDAQAARQRRPNFSSIAALGDGRWFFRDRRFGDSQASILKKHSHRRNRVSEENQAAETEDTDAAAETATEATESEAETEDGDDSEE
jgi:hypothetical protein